MFNILLIFMMKKIEAEFEEESSASSSRSQKYGKTKPKKKPFREYPE